MEQLPKNIAQALEEAKSLVSDNSKIWMRPSIDYKTRVISQKVFLFGGAYSPFFIGPKFGMNPNEPLLWRDVAASSTLVTPRLIYVDTIPKEGTLQDWLPLMESVAKENESLIVLTKEVLSQEILKTFMMNFLRGSLKCCIVKAQNYVNTKILSWLEKDISKRKGFTSSSRENLRLAEEAWIRKTSTVVIPNNNDELKEEMTDIAIIEFSGDNYRDLQRKFELMSRLVFEIEQKY